MLTSLVSELHLVALSFVAVVIVFALLVLYALRNKGDVCAEITHGRTVLRFNARDKRGKSRD